MPRKSIVKLIREAKQRHRSLVAKFVNDNKNYHSGICYKRAYATVKRMTKQGFMIEQLAIGR